METVEFKFFMIFLFIINNFEYIGARNGMNNNKWCVPEPSFDAKTMYKKRVENVKKQKA